MDGRVVSRAGIVGRDYPARCLVPLPSSYDAAESASKILRPCTRQEAYRADITYGTNNEYGFDYLRDNLIVCEPRRMRAARI